MNIDKNIDTFKLLIIVDGVYINMFNQDPQLYKEAMASDDSDKWQVTIKEEYNSLIEMGTWKVVNLPKG